MERYTELSNEFIEAMQMITSKPENLDNFRSYLNYHFGEWLKRYANTPGSITAELKSFADMEF